MKIEEYNFPKTVSYILEQLNRYGEGYIVGGAIRDILLGKEAHDFDFCTNLSYEELEEIFEKYPCIKTGKSFGVFRVQIEEEEFEIARFRSESGSDGRRPQKLEFIKTIEGDLARRDFTINAMAYHPQKGFIDKYEGEEDLKKKKIQLIGKAIERIEEDGLRIMRAFRFMSQLGFSLEENTRFAIIEKKQMIEKISKSRITEEWNKLLMGNYVMEALKEMRNTGVLEMIFPSLKALYDFSQNNPYHCYDVWEHTLHVLNSVPKDLVLRLAAIFHDIGKPLTKTVDERTGYYHFYGHEKKGAEMIRNILQGNLEESNQITKEVEFLIENHMLLHKNSDIKTVKKMISRYGKERTEKLIHLSIADNLAKNLEEISQTNLKDIFNKLIEEQKIPNLQDLAINGFDLMRLGYVGKEIQEVKEYLLEQILEEKVENKYEALIELAKLSLEH